MSTELNEAPVTDLLLETETKTEAETDLTPAPLQLGQLPVDLRFDVGSLKVSVDRLMGLRTGSVFQLEHPLDSETIKIMANGSLVAQGELVTLGDVVGVRVTKIHAPLAE